MLNSEHFLTDIVPIFIILFLIMCSASQIVDSKISIC